MPHEKVVVGGELARGECVATGEFERYSLCSVASAGCTYHVKH